MAAGILVETQYIINSWVYSYGSNKEIVNYVSFAGTIISIILAVLAIVYSYYQNFSQQRDSDSIALQIRELKGIVDRANASGEGLSEELTRLEEISKKIDESLNVVKGSKDEIDLVRKRVEEIAESQVQAKSGNLSLDLNVKEVGNALIRTAIPFQTILYRILSYGAEKSVGLTKLSHVALRSFIGESLIMWMEGQLMAHAFILIDLGVLKSEGMTPEGMRFRIVFDEFSKLAKTKFDSLGEEATFNLEGLRKLVNETA